MERELSSQDESDRTEKSISNEIYKMVKLQQRQINVLLQGNQNDLVDDDDDNIFDKVLPLTTLRKYFEFQESLQDKEFQARFVSKVIKSVILSTYVLFFRNAL